jgi:transcriptional regulator with XRE-family HTH domain
MFTNPQATIAERLKVALEYRHMTAAELSRKSKISTAALSRYMKGDYQPKQDKIYSLSSFAS